MPLTLFISFVVYSAVQVFPAKVREMVKRPLLNRQFWILHHRNSGT